MAELKVLRI